MKAIQINHPITLAHGLQLPSGAIATLHQIIVQPCRQFIAESKTYFPAQISVLLYVSKEQYELGKSHIPPDSMSEFSHVLNINIPIESDGMPKGGLLTALTGHFEKIYPGKISVINVTTPNVPVIETPVTTMVSQTETPPPTGILSGLRNFLFGSNS